MTNLILLEDEPILRDELAEFFSDQGHCVDAVCNLGEFNQCFDPAHHSIALVDLGLPDGDGLELVAHLRARSLNLGIIILTARVDTPNKVLGLGTGADHYLPKSADLDELAAVVLALAHRLERGGVNTHWILDSSTKRLIPPGRLGLELSAQDFVVLRAIITSQRLAVSKKDIVRALGANFLDYDTRRIDTQINRLRRKTLELSGCELPLKTLRNAGYQFCAPVTLR
jgi:DNA-binding response OmpR family regulator